jgi:hypothetical protein
VEAEVAMEELLAGTRDLDELREELETIMTVISKYWDSVLLSGVPQRYSTEYLKIRLAEQLAELEAQIEEDKDKHNDLVVQVAVVVIFRLRQRKKENRFSVFVCPPEGGACSSWIKHGSIHSLRQRFRFFGLRIAEGAD